MKYEHKFIQVLRQDIKEWLKRFEDEGWELVSVLANPEHDDLLQLFWKRPHV